MIEFWRRQAREIAGDRALKAYGVALCVGHLLACLFWEQLPLPQLLGPSVTPVCWPFLENCAEWARHSSDFWQLWLLAYGALALLSALLLGGARAEWGVAGFAALWVMHGLLLFQDFRLRLNQHTMLMWAGLAFLVAPGKRFTLRVLLVSFYFFAGLLKLDREWLSGAALGGHVPWLVPPTLLPVACWYVLLLELLLIFGLFSRNKWLFGATLVQLGLFHFTSFGVVGFFYPLLMAALLSLFVLDRRFPAAAEEPRRWPAVASVVVPFGLFQLLPLSMPGDSALTGQGRFLALHMFDAKLSCRATVNLQYAGRAPELSQINARLPGRIACDPLVYFHLARGVCRQQRANPEFLDLDLKLVSRRQTGPLITVVDQSHFCSEPVHYSAFSSNAWIHVRQD